MNDLNKSYCECGHMQEDHDMRSIFGPTSSYTPCQILNSEGYYEDACQTFKFNKLEYLLNKYEEKNKR